MTTEVKNKFKNIIDRYINNKQSGGLGKVTEETIRVWINELLGIFGWDIQDTRQVLQERQLNQIERIRLQEINSHNIRPDYTLVNGTVKLCFIDAKNITVNIKNDSDVAFQIRSYGWSIGAQFSIVTNFEEIAIYDCKQLPVQGQIAEFARISYFEISEYVDNFDTINMFLNRENVINNNFEITRQSGSSPDEIFADFLCSIRVKLANSILSSNNPNIHRNDTSLLGLWVQIIINRILFIRVCESRGLEEEGLLQSYTQQGFWNNFKQSSYFDFYEHYDGPIFSRIDEIHNLDIDNDVFEELLSFLYYPSPYKFDVIPVKSISDIYDLFLGRRLIIGEDGIVIDTLKDEYRKSRGAVITPTHIVQNVIERTISNSYLEELSIDELLSKTILDPACGSGVFLAEIYDTISTHLLSKLTKFPMEMENLAVVIDNEVILTIEGKKTIINNCLYGVDIDQEAVEVARMSVSLKVVDPYTPIAFQETGLLGHQILNGIGENIKCGNSLVDESILTTCPNILNSALEISKIKIFDWQIAYPLVFENGGFNFVIGNPPYVEVKNYNRELPTMVDYIKETYPTSKNGKIDLSIPFLEKGLSLLNSNGKLGYIIQKRFFKTQYGKGIRKYISENNLLNTIYDYTETNLFKDRITYVAIVVCDNNIDNNHFVKHINSINDELAAIPSNHFSGLPWDFSDIDLQNIRIRLSELGTIGTSVKIKVGIQVLWDSAYQIKVSNNIDEDIIGKSGIDSNVCIEKGACRNVICNEGITPFSMSKSNTYAIFPYRIVDNQVESITYTEYSNSFPKTGIYLNKHKETIIENVEILPDIKVNLNLNRDEHWHLFTRVQNHNATYEKVCIPMTAKYPTAIVINERDVYCDNANMFFVEIQNSTEVKMYAFAAIVNSSIFSTLARSIANPQQGGYYKFNKQFLDPIPFPKSAFDEEIEDIVTLSQLGKQIEEYNIQLNSLTPAEQNSLRSAITHLWTQVDMICYSLYGIGDSDREIYFANIRDDR